MTLRPLGIVELCHIGAHECIAVVGAGGKTGLCWLLLRDLVARGDRVIFTTTTRVRQPAPGAFDVLAINPSPLVPPGGWRTACLASSLDGAPDDRPLLESLMPVVHTKLVGFTADQIQTLYATMNGSTPLGDDSAPQSGELPMSLIIEADGARGLMLKAPGDNEPVIPATATTVCVVANLESIGQPLDARVAHRPERIAQITGAPMGHLIDADTIAAALAHPAGGLKHIPPGARRVAVLMQRSKHDDSSSLWELHPDAVAMAQRLYVAGYDHVIALSPRTQGPTTPGVRLTE